MSDKRKELERVEEINEEVHRKRPRGERRPMSSCLDMRSAVPENVQQILNFAGSLELANDTAEAKVHDQLVLISKYNNNVQKIFDFEIDSRLSNGIAKSGEHD